MSVGRFLGGFIIGGAVGAIAGLLLAPHSGVETREKLAKTSDEILGKTDESVKVIKEKADEVIGDIQQKGDELISSIKEIIKKEKEAV